MAKELHNRRIVFKVTERMADEMIAAVRDSDVLISAFVRRAVRMRLDALAAPTKRQPVACQRWHDDHEQRRPVPA